MLRKLVAAFCLTVAMIATVEAQNSFAYQAVIRTAQGELVSNQKVGMKFSLIHDGKVVYSETHTPETNQYGNVQVEVGKGKNATGDFAKVPWSTMQVMMKIEADPNGGTNYIDLGTIQLQPAPYAMYATAAGKVSAVQAGAPKSDSDALFEVKDKDGNVVFAVYPDGVRVFVNDEDTAGKVMPTGFAVSGRKAAKEGEESNIFAVNAAGTQVFVGEGDTTGSKVMPTGFAVSGRKAAKDGSDLFTVGSTGTQVYINEDATKAISTGFAVSGRKAAKGEEKYLEINADGTHVYVDDADSDKPIQTGFAVSGRKAAKGEEKILEINAEGTKIYVGSDGKVVPTGFAVSGRKAAKGKEIKLFEVNSYGTQIYIDTENDNDKVVPTGFAVSGRKAAKDGTPDKYMVIDADGTVIYVDYEEAKAMQTGFAVSGRKAAKDGTQNTILKVDNTEGTRVYIEDVDGKVMPTGFAVSGRKAAKEGETDLMRVTGDNTTITAKNLDMLNKESEKNMMSITSNNTQIYTDELQLLNTDDDAALSTGSGNVEVMNDLVVMGDVAQTVDADTVENARPIRMLVQKIDTIAIADSAPALKADKGYALLKIYGKGKFTVNENQDPEKNDVMLFSAAGNLTTFQSEAVVAVIMTKAATKDAKLIIWPLKAVANDYKINFGLMAAGDTANRYVNVEAFINVTAPVECLVDVKAEVDSLGTVAVVGPKVYGEKVDILATPIEGYHFTNWSDGRRANPRTALILHDTAFASANFEINTYKLNTTAENGKIEISVEPNADTTFNHGTEIELTAMADEHYHFMGWTDGEAAAKREFKIKSDTAFEATFAIDSFKIATLAENGEVTGAGTYAYGTEIELVATPDTLNGFHFVNWSDGNTDNPRKLTITQDSTFTANFTKNTYALTYIVDGKIDGEIKMVEYEAELTLRKDSVKTGYTFSGWTYNGNNEKPKTMPMGNLTVTGAFTINEYTITFHENNGVWTDGYVKPDNQYTVESKEIKLPTADNISLVGHTFDGWYTDSQFADGTKVTAIAHGSTGNKDLYAKWTPVPCTITFVSDDGATVSPITQNYGTLVTEPKPDRENYRFEGWFTDSDFKNAFDFNVAITGNVTLYAKWEWNVGTVTAEVIPAGAGTVKVDGAEAGTYTLGTLITIAAEPTDGYEFDSWEIDGTTVGDLQSATIQNIKVESDIRLKATFKPKMAVEFVANGGSFSGGAEKHIIYVSNDNVIASNSIPVPTREGYSFVDWLDSKGNPFDFETKISGNITLTAHWAIVYYVKSATKGGDDNHGGTNSDDDALATIARAVSKMSNTDVDYKIVVCGTPDGAQTISDQMTAISGDSPGGQSTIVPIRANSITLCGETGNAADQIDANGIGTALTINTIVPVTIKNLTITGGTEGGIHMGQFDGDYLACNVTLGANALITGNHQGNWNGEGIQIISGTLTMLEGSKVSGNTNNGYTAQTAIFVDEHGMLDMRGGEISNNGGNAIGNNGTLKIGGAVKIQEAISMQESKQINITKALDVENPIAVRYQYKPCPENNKMVIYDGEVSQNWFSVSKGDINYVVKSDGTLALPTSVDFVYYVGTEEHTLESRPLLSGDKIGTAPEAPLAKEGYEWVGWFEKKTAYEQSLVGNFISSAPFDANTIIGNNSKTYYGVWSKTVELSGSATISEIISGMDLDYYSDIIVEVNGSVGAQAIKLGDEFHSITLKGKTTSSSIDGGWVKGGELPTKSTPALTIKTPIPVIIENLIITGGYADYGGGVYIDRYNAYGDDTNSGDYANVTIGDGAQIINNYAIYGGGVYAKGWLSMRGTAEIKNNTAGSDSDNGSGGGVCLEYATFFMGGGTISGNEAIGEPSAHSSGEVGGYGGGVYVGTFSNMCMHGSAVVGDSSAKSAATSENHSNTANCGGGVYVAGSNNLYLGYKLEFDDSFEITAVPAELTGGIYYNYANANSGEDQHGNGCGGGVSVQYAYTYPPTEMMMASGHIAYNAAEIAGGGVYLVSDSESTQFTMSGGDISTNNAVLGKGVYAGFTSSFNFATFNMSGSAAVAADNDVFLGGIYDGFDNQTTQITITGKLGDGAGATITPSVYSEGAQVLSLATYYDEDEGEDKPITTTSIAAECGKFNVSTEVIKGADEGTFEYQQWRVDENGFLQKYPNVIFEGCNVEPMQLIPGAKIEKPELQGTMTVGDLSYTFKNWYTINAQGDTVVFTFNDAITRDTIIYALWDCNTEFNVQQGANIGNGTFGSIADAVAAMNHEYANYTVKVNGFLTSAQAIEAPAGASIKAWSITLTGTSNTTDGIDCGWRENGNAPDVTVSALTINTAMPVTIKNLTITGGYAASGGGISAYGTKLTIEKGCTITGNQAISGGGVYISGGELILNGGYITNNIATKAKGYTYGGGIYAYRYANVTINDGGISGNKAPYGGGVCVWNPNDPAGTSYITINGGSISNNTANKYEGENLSSGTYYGGTGAGMYIRKDAIIIITGGNITNNEAEASNTGSSDGGGLYIYSPTSFSMQGGTISGNKATYGKGIYLCGAITLGGSPQITDDVCLQYEQPITIASELKTDKAVVLSPAFDGYYDRYPYFTENPILVPDVNISDAVFASALNKFAVTPIVSSGDTTMYYIGDDAKLKRYTAVRFRDSKDVYAQYLKPGETIQDPGTPNHEAVEGVTFKFKGWYVWNGATNEYDEFTSFNTVPTGDIEIWALWDAVIVVAGLSPIQSIADAVELMTNSKYDYIIKIDGGLAYAQTIGPNANAKSITITGTHGYDENSMLYEQSGMLHDKISALGTGSVLTINTSVPVTIENLLLYAGTGTDVGDDEIVGGGLFIKSGANVTIGNNAVINSNQARLGGGVFVAQDATFNMRSGASISGNTSEFGGGVFNNGIFNMSGGTISGNQATNDAHYGNGVYYNGNFNIGGDATIAADNHVLLPEDKKITIISELSNDYVATIWPSNYSEETSWLAIDETLTQTSLSDVCGKFLVVPEENTNWYLDENGKLTTDVRINVENDAVHPYVLSDGSHPVYVGRDVYNSQKDRTYYLTLNNFSRYVTEETGANICLFNCNTNNERTVTYRITVNGENSLGGEFVPGFSFNTGVDYSGAKINVIFDAVSSGILALSCIDNYVVDFNSANVNFSVADGCTFSGKINMDPYSDPNEFFEFAKNNTVDNCYFTIKRSYVDLGLSSGNLWATCNVGADNKQDYYGEHFAWGETEGDREELYSELNYKYHDNPETLPPDNDAADANWGDGWAMPTKEDWMELYHQCYWVWTNNYNSSNVKGFIVYRAKASADKGAKVYEGEEPSTSYSLIDTHIFLPLAGYLDESSNSVIGEDHYGDYWSSTLYIEDTNKAYIQYIDSEYVSDPEVDKAPRYSGYSVRPVKRP